jgi:hypothetical protein
MIRLLAALLLLLPALPVRADDLRDAFLSAFPIYEMARTRQQTRGTADAPGIQPANFLAHRPTLSDASSRGVTTPNNDTLYSSAWLDLADGPVLLTIPDIGDRYHSVALMDARSDNFAVLGTRGKDRGRVLIAGPDWKGEVPPATRLVRATTNDVWMLQRTLVTSAADLDAARVAQRAFTLDAQGNRGRPVRLPAPVTPDAATFFDVVAESLARNPGVADKAMRKAGLVVGARFAVLPAPEREAWTIRFADLNASIRAGLSGTGAAKNGWTTSPPGIGTAVASTELRARVALGGLAALPREEAMYFTAKVDADGKPLDGANRYMLRLPKDALPVESFWSLSMYTVEPDGRLFFVDNSAQRFAIGDRSPGLERAADGSVAIRIQRLFPSVGDANWLPAPSGPFALVLRAYLPKKALLDGKAWPPAVEVLRD